MVTMMPTKIQIEKAYAIMDLFFGMTVEEATEVMNLTDYYLRGLTQKVVIPRSITSKHADDSQ